MIEAIMLDDYAQPLLFDIQCTLLYNQQYISSKYHYQHATKYRQHTTTINHVSLLK